MNAARSLKEAIQKLAGTHLEDKVKFVDCNVDSVDIGAGTCAATPIGENAAVQIININLESDVADGLLIIPVINSTITVVYSDRNVPYVFKYSDIDTVYYTGNKWQFGDGSFGGLVKLLDGVNPSLGILKKLNNLETLVNDLIGKYNTHTHTGVTTGGGVSGTTASVEPTTITPTVRGDLENTNVTQGA